MKESEVIYDIERLPNPNINELISFIFIMIGSFAVFRLLFGGSNGGTNPFNMGKNDIEDPGAQHQHRCE